LPYRRADDNTLNNELVKTKEELSKGNLLKNKALTSLNIMAHQNLL